MSRWFEVTGEPQGIIVANRVRLSRNIEGMVFPNKMTAEQKINMNSALCKKLSFLDMPYTRIEKEDVHERRMLREHRLINSAIAKRDNEMILMYDDDESVSILLNGDDHIRMQCISSDASLLTEWDILNNLDNSINEVCDYAFHEKYGYLTAFPTNMGTGLKASVLLHLPVISKERKFKHLKEEINRIGISLKGIYGSDDSENYGNLYKLSSQKTLGISEHDIIENVERFANQIAEQESEAEEAVLNIKNSEAEDEIYKSFGVLRYARKLSFKECMIYLSHLRMGITNGIIKLKNPVNIYGLMILSQSECLMNYAGRELSDDEFKYVRAQFIRESLSDIEVVN